MSASLRAAIGNPDDYHHTGLIVQCDPGEFVYCPCGVKIVYQYEIVNEFSSLRFMIGSSCAKRVGIYVGKTCDTCGERNKMKTNHCHLCRKKCPLHKKFHDDNIVHPTKKMNFTFGKHKGKTPDDLLGEFDGYLIWIVNTTEWKNPEQRQYIIDNLLSKCCQTHFRKYSTTPLGELKTKDPSYFEYMRSNDKGCYLDLI